MPYNVYSHYSVSHTMDYRKAKTSRGQKDTLAPVFSPPTPRIDANVYCDQASLLVCY